MRIFFLDKRFREELLASEDGQLNHWKKLEEKRPARLKKHAGRQAAMLDRLKLKWNKGEE